MLNTYRQPAFLKHAFSKLNPGGETFQTDGLGKSERRPENPWGCMLGKPASSSRKIFVSTKKKIMYWVGNDDLWLNLRAVMTLSWILLGDPPPSVVSAVVFFLRKLEASVRI